MAKTVCAPKVPSERPYSAPKGTKSSTAPAADTNLAKKHRLTNRERLLLFKYVSEGKTLTEAARLAGYSQKWPGQAGFQAIQNIRQKAPTLFARHGLDADTFIEKHIKPALEATNVKVFFARGNKKKPAASFIRSRYLPGQRVLRPSVWSPK